MLPPVYRHRPVTEPRLPLICVFGQSFPQDFPFPLREKAISYGRPANLSSDDPLFVVADRGSVMDAATPGASVRAFFIAKADPETGLGLATVWDIATGNGGLIQCG